MLNRSITLSGWVVALALPLFAAGCADESDGGRSDAGCFGAKCDYAEEGGTGEDQDLESLFDPETCAGEPIAAEDLQMLFADGAVGAFQVYFRSRKCAGDECTEWTYDDEATVDGFAAIDLEDEQLPLYLIGDLCEDDEGLWVGGSACSGATENPIACDDYVAITSVGGTCEPSVSRLARAGIHFRGELTGGCLQMMSTGVQRAPDDRTRYVEEQAAFVIEF